MMKALLALFIMSGFLAATSRSVAWAQAEPQEVQGPMPDRDVEGGSADCESGTCSAQHNSDDLTENAEKASLQAKGTLLTGDQNKGGSKTGVTQ